MLAAGIATLSVFGILLIGRNDVKKSLLLACILIVPFVILMSTRIDVFDRNILYMQPFFFVSIAVFLSKAQAYLSNKILSKVFVIAAVMGIGLSSFKTTYADFCAKNDVSPKITAAVLNEILRPEDIFLIDYVIDNRVRYYLSNNNKDKYLQMFKYKRMGIFGEIIAGKSPTIYCVFDGAPDFGRIANIYGIPMETIGKYYKPFVLLRQIDHVAIYRAEKKSVSGAASTHLIPERK